MVFYFILGYNIHIYVCIYFSGGRPDGGVGLKMIQEFNYETESWTEIGTMKEARYSYAVSVVSYDDYGKWCN